jgi:hypothetical protein
MDDGQWAMDDGQWAMDDGQWAMDDGQWAIVKTMDQKTIDHGLLKNKQHASRFTKCNF